MTISAIFVVACTVSEITEPQIADSVENQNTYRTDLDIIYEMGYDTTSVLIFEDYYLVDNEIAIFKNAIENYRITPQTKLNAYEERLPLEGQRIHLTIEADYSDSNYNEEDVKYAIEQWNELEDCNIMFSSNISEPYHYEWFPAVLEIHPTPINLQGGSGMITVSPLVGGGNAGIAVIKTSDVWWKKLSGEQRRYAIMHALGHLIGLKDYDENPWVPNSSSSSFDQFSIMKPSDEITDTWKDMYWNGFSPTDKIDIPALYPLYPESFSVSVSPKPEDNVFETGIQYVFTSEYESLKSMTGLSYKMLINYIDPSSDDMIIDSETGKFNVIFSEPGECNISVEMIGKNNTVRATDDIGNYVVASIVDQLNCPDVSQIKIDEPFNVEWLYENSMYPNAYVEFSAGEVYFDNGGSQNVTVKRTSDNSADITIHDYGCYRITAKLINGPQEDNVKTISISKLYRPELTVEPDLVVWDVPQSFTTATLEGFFPLPAEAFDFSNGGVSQHKVIIGDEPILSGRVHIDYALKYYINKDLLNSPDRPEHWLLVDHIGSVTFAKGESNVQYLPQVKDLSYTYQDEYGQTIVENYIPFYMVDYLD